MSDDTKNVGNNEAPARFSLSRWSERKRSIARGEAVAETPPVPPVGATTAAGVQPGGAAVAAVVSEAALPGVETLTFDSDFTVFMTGKVEESVKRAALRTLLHDPRFNVMDGLDVYIDDYSIPSPMSPEVLAQLQHSIAVLNPVFPADENLAQPADGEVPVAAAATDRIEATAAPADPVEATATPAGPIEEIAVPAGRNQETAAPPGPAGEPASSAGQIHETALTSRIHDTAALTSAMPAACDTGLAAEPAVPEPDAEKT